MRDGQAGQVGRAVLVAAAVALLVGAGGCGSASTTAPAATSTVSRTTDNFTGTVAVGGSDVHSFPVAATGVVDVTLTAAAPPAAIVMGLSLGVPADGKCNAVAGGSTRTPAGASVQLSGIVSAGTLCVDVHDAGGQSSPVSYTVTVTHP